MNKVILSKAKKIGFTAFKSPLSTMRYILTGRISKLNNLIEVNYLEYRFRTGGIKNIAITYKCNNDCEYCKNQVTISRNSMEMSKKKFVKVLEWHRRQGMEQVLLTGGEPTIHPLFCEFVNEIKKRNMTIKLNTNMMFSEKVQNAITKEVFFEIIAHYKTHNTEKQTKIYERNLSRLRSHGVNVRLRYNLYREDLSYLPILKMGRKYGIHVIDISIPHPSDIDNQKDFNSLDNIKGKKGLLIRFIKDCRRYGLKARFVVPLPMCIFSRKDARFFQKHAELHGVCNFIAPSVGETVIHPNLDVTWCNADFAHKYLKKGKLSDFRTNKDILQRYEKDIKRLCWDVHLYPQCKKCEFNKKKLCHGGCLVYKFEKGVPLKS